MKKNLNAKDYLEGKGEPEMVLNQLFDILAVPENESILKHAKRVMKVYNDWLL